MLYPLTYVQLHNMINMQGTNLGDKINAAQRGAKLLLDLEFNFVWIYFKGKLSGFPTPSCASMDLAEMPDHVKQVLGLDAVPAQAATGPAFARKKAEYVPEAFDPNDDAAAHRAAVRAASANSNRANPVIQQTDTLIQTARMEAMGLKSHTTAQVQNAQQVGESTTVVGKKKALSHAALKAQVTQEAKE